MPINVFPQVGNENSRLEETVKRYAGSQLNRTIVYLSAGEFAEDSRV